MSTKVTSTVVFGFPIPDSLKETDLDSFAVQFSRRSRLPEVGPFSHGRGDTFYWFLGIKVVESNADEEAEALNLDGWDDELARSTLRKLWESAVFERIIPAIDMPKLGFYVLANRG